jgi:uncharacterized repeat protein (TIGR02543 family)
MNKNKKMRFLWFCGVLGLAAVSLAGACKALANDETDYLMPLPDGVIVRFETGKGSYVPYVSGLAPNDLIPAPSNPIWPTGDAVATFGGWFTDNLTFSESWNFGSDRIPPDTGKYMTLYAQWQATTPERFVARNWVWNNQSGHIMGQVVALEPGETYKLYVKCWMQAGNSSQVNHVVAFCLDPGNNNTRKYSVREEIHSNNLWTEYTYTFTAENQWYVVGVFPGLAPPPGGGTFYLREMTLIKNGDTENLLRRSDFKFSVDIEEDKTYYTSDYLSNALTPAGKSGSFLPGVWYYATSEVFSLVRNQSFWELGDVVGKIAAQSGSVYLDDGEKN